jgi:hypothetical protein
MQLWRQALEDGITKGAQVMKLSGQNTLRHKMSKALSLTVSTWSLATESDSKASE